MRIICFISILFVFLACKETQQSAADIPPQTLFTLLPQEATGIRFQNQLDYTEEFNVYTYRNFYNGAGVGLGDFNNDGLIDIYFCGNIVDNELYLNRGDFRFDPIAKQAGVACEEVWSSGVSIVDINGDGWLDLYICKSGSPEGKVRHNELFINQGVNEAGIPHFTEEAKKYGLADLGLSTHAAFFDYDLDGDLDCYLLNNSLRTVGGYDLRKNQRQQRDSLGGNKLYRNDRVQVADGTPFFTDVSEEAGIYGSAIGFGLGVTIGDVNRDRWPDIYVSNDFFERDYLYLNQQDGTFDEVLESSLPEISLGSMGADMADINQDGYPEIFVTDMLPEGDARMKTKTTFDNWDKYQLYPKNGYHHQFTRNVLQLNNGPSPSLTSAQNTVRFSEIGRMAGVYATDWSWGALIMDMDNDGHNDIYVANGIYKDLTDQDYINFFADPRTIRSILQREKSVITRLVDSIPSERIPNYAFAGKGDLTFTNQATSWGLGSPSHSNGSAYGDLDNDGDLDLVVNNVNMPPFVYRNNSDTLRPEHHFLSISLKGKAPNTYGIGSQVEVRHQGKVFFQELLPMRGFQSSVAPRIHLGLGAIAQVDTLKVFWPDGTLTLQTAVSTNQSLTLAQDAANGVNASSSPQPTLSPLFQTSIPPGIDYRHQENEFNDFNRDRLIYHMLSSEGPAFAVGDVDGDGREDCYLGGAKDQSGGVFVQRADGSFQRTNEALWETHQLSEDTDALFFDADGDTDLDLYVASGGNELPGSSSALRDRLYFNDGRGNFSPSSQILPVAKYESTACVTAGDYDQDGDQDLFVGIRLQPFYFGIPVNGYVLNNDGKGIFTDVTAKIAPNLLKSGMFTDASWVDVDGDNDLDLIVVGDWMPVRLFLNEGNTFTEVTEDNGFAQSAGFWKCVAAADLDGDGDQDLITGNLGLNSRFKAGPTTPMSMHVNDFDRNGTAEQIISVYNGAAAYPLALRHDLVTQMPGLKKKYLKYRSYQLQQIQDIFSEEQLKGTLKWEAYMTESTSWINQGNGHFIARPLPQYAQLAPVYSTLLHDFDKDGNMDALIGGNFYRVKPEIGMYNASVGLFLEGSKSGIFRPVPSHISGFFSPGEIRKITLLDDQVWVAKNNDHVQVFRY